MTVLAALLLAAAASSHAPAKGTLESDLGRNETRVLAAPHILTTGTSVRDTALLERLDRLGYRRVHGRRPERPGEYFFGHDRFWIYRHACRAFGNDHGAELFGVPLDRGSGRILEGGPAAWLEPEILSESLAGDRADRVHVDLAELPEHVWRAVLAAEDSRFFEHGGLDARSLARAALRNLKSGRVVQGGSTITQQLVKNRDLSPKRSLGRKASEAMRALALEAEYDKREILEAYLNSVYMGHVEGLALHGLGTAARVYFSTDAERLDLAQAAALAAMIQGPNRLSPIDDTDALTTRRDWVLARMEELGWAGAREVARARSSPPRARRSHPATSAPRHFLSWVADEVARIAPSRTRKERGFVVETTLDPRLQALAERTVRKHLARLPRAAAALVALDAGTGAVLAYVGGDPSDPPGSFDRVRAARRQPGSLVKPFVALEALDRCGSRDPLTASSRILDERLGIDLPGGPWRPRNFDDRYLGTVLLREALAESRNVPVVRIARWCGFEATADRFERVGLSLPPEPPPSFVLGSVETSPLAVARAYTVFATPGRVLEPFPIRAIETPAGRSIERIRSSSRKVARPASAYIVRDLLRSAVEGGTATTGKIAGRDVAAKTGSTSDLRDAWFAGHAGTVVTVVWVGLDSGKPLGLTGAVAAGPLWHEFMADAVPDRPPSEIVRPRKVVERFVEPGTGLLVHEDRRGARRELYRRGTLPSHRKWWWPDSPMPVIE